MQLRVSRSHKDANIWSHLKNWPNLSLGAAFKWRVSQNGGQSGMSPGISGHFIPESDELAPRVNGVNRVFKCSPSLHLSIR